MDASWWTWSMTSNETFSRDVAQTIDALWSPGKGLTSWISFAMSNCEVVTFPLVPLVRCGAWLYRFLIFALFLTCIWINSCLRCFKCGSRGGQGVWTPPGKSQVIWVSIGNKQLDPTPRKSWTPLPLEDGGPPPEPSKMIVFFDFCNISWELKKTLSELFCQIDMDPLPRPWRKFLDPRMFFNCKTYESYLLPVRIAAHVYKPSRACEELESNAADLGGGGLLMWRIRMYAT